MKYRQFSYFFYRPENPIQKKVHTKKRVTVERSVSQWCMHETRHGPIQKKVRFISALSRWLAQVVSPASCSNREGPYCSQTPPNFFGACGGHNGGLYWQLFALSSKNCSKTQAKRTVFHLYGSEGSVSSRFRAKRAYCRPVL